MSPDEYLAYIRRRRELGLDDYLDDDGYALPEPEDDDVSAEGEA